MKNPTTKHWKEYSRQKWIDPENLELQVKKIRAAGSSIATINGSFDLLHAGHLHILFEAAKQADILIVALNTDSSIRRYKSLARPIIPLEYRLEAISALEFVDYVTWFDETDPRAILSRIRPDIHVNGAEYGKNCIEAEVVRLGGGHIHIVDLIDGLSTTQITKKICDVSGVAKT
jgi:rfaE bifunctional protein nucleotidyltransferase chain/domain